MNTQDTELVLRALQGDKKAFGELVDKYQGVVYGLCFHLVGNFADAQDLAQEAFVQAYLDLHQLREPDKFANWLYRVTTNVCKMWLRKRKPDVDSLETISPTEFISALPSPQELVEREELQLMVRRAIDSLSGKNRLTITLYYMDGLSYQEISDFLDVPVSTIKSRLHKARLQLKEKLIKMVE
ncbi:MAG: RNA polymerase sigma factor, partial [Candidatus Poribacteria bacterium]